MEEHAWREQRGTVAASLARVSQGVLKNRLERNGFLNLQVDDVGNVSERTRLLPHC